MSRHRFVKRTARDLCLWFIWSLVFQFIHQKSIKRHVNKLSNVQFHGILKHLPSGFSLRVISIKIIDVGVDILRKSGKFSNTEEVKRHPLRVDIVFLSSGSICFSPLIIKGAQITEVYEVTNFRMIITVWNGSSP